MTRPSMSGIKDVKQSSHAFSKYSAQSHLRLFIRQGLRSRKRLSLAVRKKAESGCVDETGSEAASCNHGSANLQRGRYRRERLALAAYAAVPGFGDRGVRQCLYRR